MPRGSIAPKPDRGADAWQIQASAGSDPLTGRRQRLTRLVRGTRADAEKSLTALLTELDDKPQATEGTVGHLLEERWRLSKPDWSPKTAHGCRSIMDHRHIPDLDIPPASAMRWKDLPPASSDGP